VQDSAISVSVLEILLKPFVDAGFLLSHAARRENEKGRG